MILNAYLYKIAMMFITTIDNVSNVIVDEEFGCVTATVNGRVNVSCGFIEEYN